MKENVRCFLLTWFERLERHKILRILPDKVYLKLLFRLKLNKPLNLREPKTYNEKLQWLKLYNRNHTFTTMVDKYAVKKLIADRIGEKYVVPCIGGPWYSFDEIDFEQLPNQFVLKTNHDSGGIVICRDKTVFNKDTARFFLEERLAKNYYWSGREWPYKNIKPCIFAELLLDDESDDAICDYKFFCFDGIPQIMYLSRDKSDNPRTDFFDMEYRHLNMQMRDPNAETVPSRPEQFEEMKQLAKVLSKGIPHVRVDFYVVAGQIYIGEITFFHCSGFVEVKPEYWNNVMGNWISLP